MRPSVMQVATSFAAEASLIVRRLYVAEFPCGTLKVGITKMLGDKRGQMLRFRGAHYSRIYYGARHLGGYEVEQQLRSRIAEVSSPVDGREWVTGIAFDSVQQTIDSVTQCAIHEYGRPPELITRTSRRGFASMTVAQRRAIASMGGKAAHELGVAHEWTSAGAADAGRKGGHARASLFFPRKPGDQPALAPSGERTGCKPAELVSN